MRALAALLLLLVPGVVLAPLAEARDDVVFVIVDDVARFSYGFYGEPEAIAAGTPTFDTIASNGVAFTAWTGSPICSPFRAALMLGVSPYRPESGIGAVITEDAVWELDPQSDHLIRKLNATGWRTALVGKWHLGIDWTFMQPQSHPTHMAAMGFDLVPVSSLMNPNNEFPLLTSADHCEGGTCTLQGDHTGECTDGPLIGSACFVGTHNSWVAGDGAGTVWLEEGYTTDIYTAAARAILADGDPQKTFMLLSYNAAHFPFTQPPGGSCIDDTTCYDEMISHLDTSLALVVGDLDYADDTICIIADNGRPNNFIGTVGRCGTGNSKTYPYECGVGVPFACRGKLVAGNGSATALGQATDLHATLLAMLGALEAQGGAIDSQDQSACLADPAGCVGRAVATSQIYNPLGWPWPDPATTTERNREGGRTLADGSAVGYYRTQDADTGAWDTFELIDLEADLYATDPGNLICEGDPCLPAPTPEQQTAIDQIEAALDGTRQNGGAATRPLVTGVRLEGVSWE
jgi:hypothetical protein